MLDAVHLLTQAEALTEWWSPRVVGRVGDQYVKVAKVKGAFVWHDHAQEDELFLVLKGTLRIELEDGEVELTAGSCCVVPRGVRHRPVADAPCFIALIEPVATQHTGEVQTPQTRSVEEQLGLGDPSAG
jgi:mannose-6-phosphate isomerase-like protein (cupin superfamily)